MIILTKTMNEKHQNIENLLNHMNNIVENVNKKFMTSSPENMDCRKFFSHRSDEMCSWFIPNMELINEIIKLHITTKLPVYDMGCGYGLMVALLNYLDIPCYGLDNNSETYDRQKLIKLLQPFNIILPSDDKFVTDNINNITGCDFIFFQSWGRSTECLKNYINNGGKYIIIVGEDDDGCTHPSASFIKSKNYDIKSSIDIKIPVWTGIRDWANISVLN